MTRIYLIRHCEALGNAKRLFQGTTDLDISELGEIQLSYLAKRFEDIDIDVVYSSPLIRAKKTAHSVADPKNLPVITDDGLAELDGGIVEGKPFAQSFASIEGLADVWNNHPQDLAIENGETMRHAYERIWETVKKIATANKDKNIVIATHGGVLRCLICRLKTNDINELKNISWCENTSVTLVEFDGNFVPDVKYANDHSHVPGEYLPVRNRIVSISKAGKSELA